LVYHEDTKPRRKKSNFLLKSTGLVRAI